MKKQRIAAKAVCATMALLLAASPMTAFATGTEPAEPGTLAAQPMSGERTHDDRVGISGLQPGDTVRLYKVLEWDGEWKLTSAFSSLDDKLYDIAHGVKDEGSGAVVPGGISAELAGEIASAVTDGTDHESLTADDSGSVTKNIGDSDVGLYMGIIVPAASGFMYNPVFVGADFNPDNTVLKLSPDELSYDKNGRAKLSTISVKKTVDNDQFTSDVGETVGFTVTTTIPVFAENYTAPVFKVTDVMSAGLELNFGSVSVDGTDADGYDVQTHTDADGRVDGYVVSFREAYLKSITSPVSVTITYGAKITEAAKSVNQENNTITVNYSTDPSDTEGHGIVRDRTNHYTFDLDGILFGTDSDFTSEFIKVGVDAEGNEFGEEVILLNGQTVKVLEGATFKLTTTADKDADAYENGFGIYNNIMSTSDGRIPISGLEAGTYYLWETAAPAGYIAFQDYVKIDIATVMRDKTVTETEEVDGVEREVTYDYKELASYTVTVQVGKDGTPYNIASYELVNDESGDLTGVVDKADGIQNDEAWGKIYNTQGVALPSTGGVGTTMIYVLGACLVVGGGVVLAAKKRVGRKDAD